MATSNNSSGASTVLLAFIALSVLVIAGVANVVAAGAGGTGRLVTWLVTVLAIVILCGCIGRAISQSWTGVIEDARNRVSLSRLQMLLWTILVLSAFITAAASNFALDPNIDALSVVIPSDLLGAMGIAATSLVAAPAVLSLKAAPPTPDGTVANVSTGIHVRSDDEEASWLDIFRGDENGNCATPDLSKIQQFLITLALVGLYGCLVGRLMLTKTVIHSLPGLNQNFLWLLGISHAGYLVYKAVPHPAAPSSPSGTSDANDDSVG